ncbi:MAG: DUF86 domain-containing protein [Patescibacteria group bacterium]
MNDRDSVYLRQMLEAIGVVAEYIDGKKLTDLESDRMLQDAVIRKIEVIGEAARRLSGSFLKAHAELSLLSAITMRNKLIHEYDDIDLKVVWDTVSVDLPKLGEAIEKLL